MASKTENIFVDYDYQNIVVVDPNKITDENGQPKDRLVQHENLVMYANLECDILPRTKLAVGQGNNGQVMAKTISVATMNFLKPGGKKFMDNSYTDEITGNNTINSNDNTGKRLSQPTGSVDNGMLGITAIDIKINTSFQPIIKITMEDVKGRALFEGGDNSPYAAFFNLPYPMFTLTLKGYFGKAIKYPLMLQNFAATFDTSKGNYVITTTFYTYKYSVLSELNMGYLLATPHMYPSNLKIEQKTATSTSTTDVENVTIEKGYQKMREVYSDYKSKGLIPTDFPELTVLQMVYRLDNFIKNVLDSFTKQNMTPLTNGDEYSGNILKFQQEVYLYGGTSWFDIYLDTKNPYIDKNGIKFYTFKKELSAQNIVESSDKLIGLINNYNKILNDNPTFGTNGSYKIDGKDKSSSLTSPITPTTCNYDFNINNIDFKQTYLARVGTKTITGTTSIEEFKAREILNLQGTTLKSTDPNGNTTTVAGWFWFEGKNSFMDLTNQLRKNFETKKKEIENALSDALASIVQSKNNGIGFVPTIRNVLAVIMAGTEGFLRLLDDVHTTAWDQRKNPTRIKAILNGTPTKEYVPNNNNDQIIYPWPQYLEENVNDKGEERYEISYPGDSKSLGLTKGYLSDVWPEVEFVEEFIRGFVQRDLPSPDLTVTDNLKNANNMANLDVIEYPLTDAVYLNKQDVKFFYEIYERLYTSAVYSKFNRGNSKNRGVYQVISELEKNNIVTSLGSDNPYLIQKLKQFNINSANIIEILKHISNEGAGESWQNYLRGLYNTGYLKSFVENSFTLIFKNKIQEPEYNPNVSILDENQFAEYVSDSSTNEFELTDTFPFTNLSWVKSNMSNGSSTNSVKQNLNTKKTISYNNVKKKVTNFNESDDFNTKRPITFFNYLDYTSPSDSDLSNLKTFFSQRSTDIKKQAVTEGNLIYDGYTGQTTFSQTTSILNTPYFINSIQLGVENYRNGVKYPYKEAAYLFINSLPLATLREKYTTYDTSKTDLDYIFATFKKFGALHRVPYAWVLKYGSIWNRYKTWVETGNDYIDNVWKDFDAVLNFDPITNTQTTSYNLVIDGNTKFISLNSTLPNGLDYLSSMSLGFYPKLINDFNVFYQGTDLFTGYTDAAFQQKIDSNDFYLNVNTNNVRPKGFDLSYTGRSLNLSTYTCFSLSKDKQSYYILPSHGGRVNQTIQECFDSSKQYSIMKTEIGGNKSVWNGSARLFFDLPNYGYFDSSLVKKPTPQEYLKKILNTESQQQNFVINGLKNDYSDISEMFSVFDRKVLDILENEFLKFSQSVYDFDDSSDETLLVNKIQNASKPYLETNCDLNITQFKDGTENDILRLANNYNISVEDFKKIALGQETAVLNSTYNSEIDFKNFQSFMRTYMKVPSSLKNTNFNQMLQNVTNSQNSTLVSGLKNLLQYDIYLRYGNPSNFDKKIFYTFSNSEFVYPYTYSGYFEKTPNAVPTNGGGITLQQSKQMYPDAWKALEESVGFSTITNLKYSDNGSYITDFFPTIDVEFSEANVVNLSALIKIFATQKLENPNLSKSDFLTSMTNYINTLDDFNSQMINSTFILLRNSLPNVDSQTNRSISVLEGPQPKKELWETFKSLNDKWISGTDFKQKTLFEDFLFLDRASRNIGDKVLVDIFKLKSLLTDINVTMPILTTITSIIQDNNFVIFNTPSYINFYNVQEVSKNPKPNVDSATEFANSLFGTFTEVDYRNTGPKMVCLFGGVPSSTVEMENNPDFKFGTDIFDLKRAEPLLDNLQTKTDWDKSNKVVGFNVDIGVQNQQFVKSFSINQDNGQATAESLEILNKMANQSGGRTTATQNISLFNLYKNRSYQCTLSVMGNAMLQPTMYFNLRYVPMFFGPYMILEVDHTIRPNTFDTVISGVRQPVYSLSKIDNYLQSIKVNLLQEVINKAKKEIEAKKKEELDAKKAQQKNTEAAADSKKTPDNNTSAPLPNTETSTDSNAGTQTNSQNNTNNPTNSQVNASDSAEAVGNVTSVCTNSLSDFYKDIYKGIKPKQTYTPHAAMIKEIKNLINVGNYNDGNKLLYLVYCTMYLNCGDEKGLTSYENNYTGVVLDNVDGNWGRNESCTVPPSGILIYFPSQEYFCLGTKTTQSRPYALFESTSNNIKMLLELWKQRTKLLPEINAKEIAKFWTNNFSQRTYFVQDSSGNITTNKWDNDLSSLQREELTKKTEEAINILDGTL